MLRSIPAKAETYYVRGGLLAAAPRFFDFEKSLTGRRGNGLYNINFVSNISFNRRHNEVFF
jgi:hypothetical protein